MLQFPGEFRTSPFFAFSGKAATMILMFRVLECCSICRAKLRGKIFRLQIFDASKTLKIFKSRLVFIMLFQVLKVMQRR